MANYNKCSRIGTILHDKNSYMGDIQRQSTPEMKENEERSNYISIEEYTQMMKKIHYSQMIQTIQVKQEKRQSTEILFQAFFYIPILIYNTVFCTSTRISNV